MKRRVLSITAWTQVRFATWLTLFSSIMIDIGWEFQHDVWENLSALWMSRFWLFIILADSAPPSQEVFATSCGDGTLVRQVTWMWIWRSQGFLGLQETHPWQLCISAETAIPPAGFAAPWRCARKAPTATTTKIYIKNGQLVYEPTPKVVRPPQRSARWQGG